MRLLCAVALSSLLACAPRARVPRPSGSGELTLVHHDKMGKSYRLRHLTYEVDGRLVHDRRMQRSERKLVILQTQLPAGSHTVVVFAEYRGHGSGVFSYLNDDRFKVRSEHKITLADADRIQLDIVAFEKGGATTPLDERPALEFHVKRGGLE